MAGSINKGNGYKGKPPKINSLNRTGKSYGPKVSEKMFGMSFMDRQSSDEPWDPNSKVQAVDGVFITGRGSQGGGSKPTPQAQKMTTGSGSRSSTTKQTGSYPRHTQKIRG
jgi:hypothetical protein